MHIFTRWFKQHLSDPQVIILLLILVGFIAVIMTMGQFLTPVILSLILAYLLEGLVRPLQRLRVPRFIAVLIVFFLFLFAFLFLLLGLVPLLSKQIGQFIQDLPQMISSWQTHLMQLPERYPEFITKNQVNSILDTINTQIAGLGQDVLSISYASVRGAINIIVYMVLVPVMVFFFLKDKHKIVRFLQSFLPQNIDLASQVWAEVNQKTAKFIQGKIWEIFIVWAFSYLTFFVLDLRFAILLSFLVGISVIVPYVGATVMTIPVALVAYFQWGWDAQFAYVLLAYLIIQVLDGNVLVPVLLSGIVNLHPLAVIIGILIFGGIWGFWGVLFAIPLATLVHAIIKAWPKMQAKPIDNPNE